MIPLTKPRILVVDDDSGMRWAVEKALRGDFEVLVAASGDEALEHIETSGVLDALVTDFDLKNKNGVDGLAVAHAMRVKFSNAPLILITGSLLIEPRIQAFQALPRSAVFQKPFQRNELINKINSLLT